MNNHIIVDFRPFAMNQNIMVYIEGECKETIGASIDNIVPIVNSLCEKYNINRVDLCGNASYLSKFKQELIAVKYGNININVIERS